VAASKDLFACKVVGESMNKRIPNGSMCLFTRYSVEAYAGSRGDLIVLVQHAPGPDPDMGSYTVKKYKSTKEEKEEGVLENVTITLSPMSNDKKYKPISLNPADIDDFAVIGVFLRVLETPE